MAKIELEWLHWPETKALTQAIVPLRFVGGCVRDALLARKVRDIDAATPILPQEVMQRLKGAGIKAIPTGIDHGTVTAVIEGKHFEITTLRRDVSTDGRHATVAFSEDWAEDAARRDFTMNALFCDLQGNIFDYYGGEQDARTGHVRFIGEARERIREDALRILRFFRFFAYYGQGEPDAQGIAACAELAQLIDGLSGERIQQEMLKLLVAPRPTQTLELMQKHGVLKHVMPQDMKPGILAKLAQGKPAIVALALLLRSAPDADVQAVSNRWKLSRAQHKRLLELCDAEQSWSVADERIYKRQIRAWGAELFGERVAIAVAEGSDEQHASTALQLAQNWEIPTFPITGEDLIAFGMQPGRALGEKLKSLEELWETGNYSEGRDALLTRLKQ